MVFRPGYQGGRGVAHVRHQWICDHQPEVAILVHAQVQPADLLHGAVHLEGQELRQHLIGLLDGGSPRQAQFHPLMYLTAVAGAIERATGRIFTGTHVETIKGGKPARIKTAGGRVPVAATGNLGASLAEHIALCRRVADAGADVVTRETFGSALIMGEEALRLLGYDEARAYRVMRTFKRHDEDGLRKLYAVWGDEQAYGLGVRQSVEQLEKVLRDDSAETETRFREAYRFIHSAESRNPADD